MKTTHTIATALNAAESTPDGRICVALNATADGNVPEWAELIPPGQLVLGLDGRNWILPNAQQVIDTSNAYVQIEGRGAVLDEEHKTQLREFGGPAFGWFEEYRLNAAGGIEARINWTDLGIEAVKKRHYRFISVVFDYDYDSREIIQIVGGGLTNKNNLRVPALNNKQTMEEPMDPKLMAALGLTPSGDPTKDLTAALNAIQKLHNDHTTALNAQKDLVPRADLQTALNAKEAAETKLKEIEAGNFKAKVETAVNAATTAGKVSPATKQYHLDTIKTAEALNRFEETYGKAPPLVPEGSTAPTGSPEEQPALNAVEKSIGDVFGNSADDFKKYGGEA